MAPILEGIRVIDLSNGIAGPYAAMLFAEAGADVVKVEPAAGSPDRSLPGFRTWNRSKRSVVADLDTDDGRAVVHQLVAVADVLIHDLVPDRARALGLDDATLTARHPQLIVSSVLAWPANHEKANRAVDELLAMAELGICDEQMPQLREGPVYIRAPIASWCSAYLAACGIVARLLHRHQSGRGGVAHTSLVQGVLVPMGMHWSRAENPSPPLAFGMPKETRGSQATLFECSDGEWIHTMPPGPDRTPLMQKLLAEMGPDKVAEANLEGASSPAGLPNGGANRAAMKKRTCPEWLDEFWNNDVPAQRAARFGDVLRDKQARDNDYVIELDDPEHGRITVPGLPFSIEPPLRVVSAAPALGAHTAEVLAEWTPRPARTVPAAAGADTKRYPLEGLKVLDLGNFLAGPYGPQVLADLGADVIKLEAATGDPMRPGAWPFAGCQRGKRGLAIDLKAPESRPVLDRALRWADVVHHNLRMPAARRLGLDPASVQAVNPKAVVCHTSSYGPKGERADWPGYDQLFQAQCGWERLGAGEGNHPMWHRFGFMDHLCALGSALATLLGCYRYAQTGETSVVTASLLGSGTMTNSETFIRPDGTLAPFVTLDAQQTTLSSGRQIAQTADGWIAIAADTPARAAALRDASKGDIATRTSAEMLTALDAAGVPCGPVTLGNRYPFFDDAANKASKLVVSYQHAEWGKLEQPGALWFLGDLDGQLHLAPPALGEHTTEVLTELGLSSDEIAALVAKGVAACFS